MFQDKEYKKTQQRVWHILGGINLSYYYQPSQECAGCFKIIKAQSWWIVWIADRDCAWSWC